MYTSAWLQVMNNGTRFILRTINRGKTVVRYPITLEFFIRQYLFVGSVEEMNVFVALNLKEPRAFAVNVIFGNSIGRCNEENRFEPFNVFDNFCPGKI